MLAPRGIVPKVFSYCVALAAERHGIEVHAMTVMSNHWHAVVTDPYGRIPEFSRVVHSLSARALDDPDPGSRKGLKSLTNDDPDPGSCKGLKSLTWTSDLENSMTRTALTSS